MCFIEYLKITSKWIYVCSMLRKTRISMPPRGEISLWVRARLSFCRTGSWGLFTSLGITPSRSIHVVENNKISSFVRLSKLHCVYILHLYPLICWWTLRLFLYVRFCKQYLCFWISVFIVFRYISRSEIAGSWKMFFF